MNKNKTPHKPHRHAELIKKWADDTSLTFQSRINESGTWADTKPDWSINVEYRIKPEVIRYRIALMKSNGYNWLKLLTIKEQEEAIKFDLNFVEWLTDWIEVEI